MKARFLPESLFGRLLTALLVTIGITLLVVVALLLRERRESLFVGSDAAAIVSAIDTTVEQLVALSPVEREDCQEHGHVCKRRKDLSDGWRAIRQPDSRLLGVADVLVRCVR